MKRICGAWIILLFLGSTLGAGFHHHHDDVHDEYGEAVAHVTHADGAHDCDAHRSFHSPRERADVPTRAASLVDAAHGDTCCGDYHLSDFRLVAPLSIIRRVLVTATATPRVTLLVGTTRPFERPPRIA
jgi:hypothetical protein